MLLQQKRKMKRKTIYTLIFLMVIWNMPLRGQGVTGELRLSVKEAQEYALENNRSVLSARADVEASRMALWETISAGLPQIEASGSFTDNLKLMTTLLPGEFMGMPGEKIPVTFGSKYNSSASVQASMVLFNAPLFIGIKTTELAGKLSQQSLEKSEQDTRESVSTTYYLILVSERSRDILDQIISNLKETLTATKAMFAAGMAEATDVDQMVLNVTTTENSRIMLERNIEMNYNLLRFQLGVPATAVITLTETLDAMMDDINVEALLSQTFEYSKNVNYKLVESQELMSSLSLRSQKASILPSLAAFYDYGTSGMGDKISDLEWFPNSMTGLQLSVPIFASGQRYAKIARAKLELEKATLSKDMVTEQLLIQEKQYRYNLVNANLQYTNQRDNVDLAGRVYESTENKYRQGMASSLELTQANSLFLQAENSYISSLLQLLQSKLALDKLLNNF